MLVYANTLHFESDIDFEMALLILEQNISQLTGEDISLSEEVPTYPLRHFFKNGSRSVFSKYVHNEDAFFSLKYSRRDNDVATRLWHTTITFSREIISEDPTRNTTDCKIIVDTEDAKPSDVPAAVYVPPIVGKFMKHLSLSHKTPPPTATTLEGGDEVYALDNQIDNIERRFALVLVCPDDEDNFPIQSGRLAYLTAGLAQVYEIGIDADWDYISDTIGWRFTPRSGEIKVIYPVKQTEGFLIPQYDYKQFKIAQLREQGLDVEQELFTQIAFRICRTHAYNRQNTPESIANMLKQRKMEMIKKEALLTAEQHISDEFKDLFEHTDKELDQLREDSKRLKAENRRLKYELQNLKDSFTTTPSVPTKADLNLEELKKILDCTSERFLVEDCLNILQTTFPERIVVLNSAFDSAYESRVFREKKKLFNLLWKLSTDYYQALCEGKPDSESRKMFGDVFSAKESETVESHSFARQSRTFNYNGEAYEMMAHLKIGYKDSLADTLRVHFRWFANEKKIVIGHCGKHLWKLGGA